MLSWAQKGISLSDPRNVHFCFFSFIPIKVFYTYCHSTSFRILQVPLCLYNLRHILYYSRISCCRSLTQRFFVNVVDFCVICDHMKQKSIMTAFEYLLLIPIYFLLFPPNFYLFIRIKYCWILRWRIFT